MDIFRLVETSSEEKDLEAKATDFHENH